MPVEAKKQLAALESSPDLMSQAVGGCLLTRDVKGLVIAVPMEGIFFISKGHGGNPLDDRTTLIMKGGVAIPIMMRFSTAVEALCAWTGKDLPQSEEVPPDGPRLSPAPGKVPCQACWQKNEVESESVDGVMVCKLCKEPVNARSSSEPDEEAIDYPTCRICGYVDDPEEPATVRKLMVTGNLCQTCFDGKGGERPVTDG